MTDPETTHVISTSRDQVWLVDDSVASTPDGAIAHLNDRYPEADWNQLYYEGTLDEHLSDLRRDGEAVLNP